MSIEERAKREKASHTEDDVLKESIELKNKFNKSQFNFKVMDAHNSEFPDNTFDLIIGNGILHHLDFNVALQSI
tara:strand:+ start:176 stop:397 length:222 start_codon:yes stop_codon:yes gene_type:complete